MKLYRIDASYEILVAADDEDEAVQVAIDNAIRALQDSLDGPEMSVQEITETRQIPESWRGCYPYREDGATEETVDEIVAASAGG